MKMGFFAKRKEQRRNRKGFEFIIKTTIETTGCTRDEAINRFLRVQKSKLIEGESEESLVFQFVVDKYMCGEVNNDTELAELLIKPK